MCVTTSLEENSKSEKHHIYCIMVFLFIYFLPTTWALARSIEFRHHLSCVYFAVLFWRVWQMLITCVALKARETCHVLPRKRRTKHIFFQNGVLLQKLLLLWSTAWSPASTCLHQSSHSDTSHIVPYILCFCPQKYSGLPRRRDSQFWQHTLGSTSNTDMLSIPSKD